jgi:hypothetical protein
MKRYVVAYIEYQHAALDDDDAYDGWLSSYTSKIFFDEKKARKFLMSLKEDHFVKDPFMAIEVQ